jgi:uncharacterized protein
MLRITALEEHFVTRAVVDAWRSVDARWQDLALGLSSQGPTARRLLDIGADRITEMDDAGITVQVLSLSTPGLAMLAPADAIALQSMTNDQLAEAIRTQPDRLQGLATLATPVPEKAAQELERAVCGLGLNGAMLFAHSRSKNLDDRSCWPIFEAAAALRAPLYLHPQSPPPAVRQSYYTGFDPALNTALSTHGIGWHYDTGIQVLRLILSGVFDHFPELQLIIGHWGEMILFYLDRIDDLRGPAKLARRPSEYFSTNIMITPSGVLSDRYLRWAAEVIGIDRIMFATDYPFVSEERDGVRRFLETADLTDAEREAVAFRNWEAMCAGIRR